MFKLLLVCAVLLVATPAAAHTMGLSQSDFTVEAGGKVHAEIVFARTEAIRLGHSPGELRTAMQAGVFVSSDHAPCPGAVADIGEVEGDGLRVTMDFACAPPRERVDVDLRVLGRLDSGHRHALRIASGSTSHEELLADDARTASLSIAEPAPPKPWLDIVVLGAQHILTGWDHLLFLFALLLGTRAKRDIVLAISSFTVAHSLTLALAALDVITIDARWVESAIAASIAYVAYENVLRAAPVHRWRITFVFGLVHGFGFAGGLRDLGLGRDRLLPTLLGFNLGVELGQLAVVLLLLPILMRLQQRTTWARGLSIAVGITGMVLCAWRMAEA